MPGKHPKARTVTCPRCKARPNVRCSSGGKPVSWHHAERLYAADAPVIGRTPIPLADEQIAEGRRRYAAGESPRKIAADLGISRNTFYRRVLPDVPRQRTRQEAA